VPDGRDILLALTFRQGLHVVGPRRPLRGGFDELNRELAESGSGRAVRAEELAVSSAAWGVVRAGFLILLLPPTCAF
jgi:hypothetical protein